MKSELLNRFKKAVEGLDAATGNDETPKMTADQFIEYATEQMEKAAKDSPEVRIERLKSLRANVELAKQEYSFEGSSNTFGGLLAVTQFRDPDQVQTTEKTQSPASVSDGVTAFSQTDIQPSVNGAGNVTGDKMPPLVAAGSGFEPPTSASFAKALDELENVLASLTGDGESGDGKTGDAGGEDKNRTETNKSKGGKIETKKGDADGEGAVDTFWPFDMNTAFGRGETENPEIPEWGVDGKPIPEDKPAEA